MILDGLSLKICADELKDMLPGAKITRINMPAREDVVFQLYTKTGSNVKLNISASADSSSVFLGDMKRPNPKTPPAFCMLLRKHLTNAHIESIESSGTDRTLSIGFSSKDELMRDTRLTLVCEIMGKYSNIILLNDKGRVMDSVKRVSVDVSSLRQILPGSVYTAPPQEQYDILSLSDASMEDILKNADGNWTGFLCRSFQGVSKATALEILARADIDPECSTPDDRQKKRIQSVLKEFFTEAVSNPDPTVQLNGEDCPVLVTPLPFTTYPEDLRKSFPSMNEAVFFLQSGRYEYFTLKQKKDTVSRLITKARTKLARKIKTLSESIEDSKKADTLISHANMITANIYRLDKGADCLEAEDYESGETVRIQLDKSLTPSQNAQKLYKRAAKMKTTKEIYEKRLKEAVDEDEFLSSSLMFVSKAESAEDIEEIEGILSKEKVIVRKGSRLPEVSEPKEYISPSGYTVYVGRNDRQNDRLTMGIARKGDIWFHAQKMPGAHVLLVTDGRDINDIDDETIVFAAKLAAKYSSAKLGGKTPVDYTYRQNIKKPPASRPGKVIYDKYWTVYVD